MGGLQGYTTDAGVGTLGAKTLGDAKAVFDTGSLQRTETIEMSNAVHEDEKTFDERGSAVLARIGWL